MRDHSRDTYYLFRVLTKNVCKFSGILSREEKVLEDWLIGQKRALVEKKKIDAKNSANTLKKFEAFVYMAFLNCPSDQEFA